MDNELKELESYFDRLWPICRSITGNGLRESFKILQELIPLELTEVPTGTRCFDWEIPKEWNVRDAYLISPEGRKIVDFKVNNLHLLNYSVPVKGKFTLEELRPHLFSIPSLPEAIPYVTSYYKENWGFCMTHNELSQLKDNGLYEVMIDTELTIGSLTYGDLILKGSSDREILFSSYLCHPSMANNELSGPLCMAMLYKRISSLKNRKYTYRFVLAPETIGVIAYLSKHGMYMKQHTEAGYVLTCCGDPGQFVYKHSKQVVSLADRFAKHVFDHSGLTYEHLPFSVGGSDERQYCSPGFNLPVGSITRSMYQRYKEYHTSLDNKSFISFKSMQETVDVCFDIVQALEMNETYSSTVMFGEPQLGKRGLYPDSALPVDDRRKTLHQMMHFISYCDGILDVMDIAEKGGYSILSFGSIIADLLREKVIQKTNS